ncbi:hypothetical protein HGRIS_011107 [Hohenbuehelia grisea]|uniref:Protein kinase domain-containing protein n=1 Tax=Hohenbuehelia grisea TaxID=104357 RepID=A0ABR3IYV0_9AGAR
MLSVFEWAGMPAYLLMKQPQMDTVKERLSCLRALSELHNHHIQHGQLIAYHDLRHILWDPVTKSARLIDFFCASADHNCKRSFPPPYATRGRLSCCSEVGHAADSLDLFVVLNAQLDQGDAKPGVSCDGQDTTASLGETAHNHYLLASG